ncbi:hypothetical protein ABW20_dc0108967 [Dactylellina cionopaga]|nr:hypothetical protein ABW20_dc0108967 [Dactylellina cionopaga]
MKVTLSTTIASWMLCAAHFAHATPPFTSEKLQALVTKENLLADLKEFDRIASENGGDRAFGKPGYTSSVNYVKSRLDKAKRFKSWTQDYDSNAVKADSLSLHINGKEYPIKAPVYAPISTEKEGVTASLVIVEAGGPNFCEHPQWKNITDISDKIVLYRQVNCHSPGHRMPGGEGVPPGVEFNALGYIFFNDNYEPLDTTKRSLPMLEKRKQNKIGPMASISRTDGLELMARLNAGEEITAHLKVNLAAQSKIPTQNVFAESRFGDKNHNKIRFAWWANGVKYRCDGSEHYVSSLKPEEAESVLMYLNFDMVSRGHFGVYDGSGKRYGYYGYPGSDIIEKLFVDYFTSKGLMTRPVHWHGDSDYRNFMQGTLIRPAGGLHGGDSVPQDACFGESCDTFANANGTHLEINAKAAAHVLYVLAGTYTQVIPAVPYNATAAAMLGY